LREEKINYNKFINSKIIEENKLGINNFKINTVNGTIEKPLFIKKVNESNKNNKIEGNIIKKTTNKNLFNLLYKIKKYLYRKDFVKFGGNSQKKWI